MICIDRAELAAALAWSGRSKWTTIAADDALTVTSGDPLQCFTTTIPASGDAEIPASVMSSNLLGDIVSALHGETIRLARADRAIRLECGASIAEIPTAVQPNPAEMARAEPTTPATLRAVVATDELADGLAAVAGAMQRDLGLPSRMGAIITPALGAIRMESTDNYAAAVVEIPADWIAQPAALSSSRVGIAPPAVMAMRRLASAIDVYAGDEEAAIVLHSDRTVSAERGGRRISVAAHESSIPDLVPYLADEIDADRCLASPSELLAAIRLASITGERIAVEMKPTSITVSGVGNDGRGSTTIGGDWSGEACRLHFGRRVLEAALRPHASADYVGIVVGSGRRVIFSTAEIPGIRTAAVRLASTIVES